MMSIRPNVLRLAAYLLKQAASEFSRHGCNDMKWPAYFTDEDRESMRASLESLGDPIEDLHQQWSPGDWVLMLAVEQILKEAVKRAALGENGGGDHG